MKFCKEISVLSAAVVLATAGLTCSNRATPTIPDDTPPEVREQIERLSSRDVRKRRDAADKLGSMGEKAAPAVPSLIKTLDDDPSPLTIALALALVKMRFTTTDQHLVELAFSPAYAAERALSQIGEPAVEPLIEALRNRSPLVRARAAQALGEIGDSRSIRPLIAALQDKHRFVRAGAALGLLRSGLQDARACDALVGALHDEHPSVRSVAADALGSVGDSRAAKPLIAALNDQHKNVRMFAATALGSLGESCAVESLIATLKDPNRAVRNAAAAALEKITGQDFGQDQVKWRRWCEQNKEQFENRIGQKEGETR